MKKLFSLNKDKIEYTVCLVNQHYVLFKDGKVNHISEDYELVRSIALGEEIKLEDL